MRETWWTAFDADDNLMGQRFQAHEPTADDFDGIEPARVERASRRGDLLSESWNNKTGKWEKDKDKLRVLDREAIIERMQDPERARIRRLKAEVATAIIAGEDHPMVKMLELEAEAIGSDLIDLAKTVDKNAKRDEALFAVALGEEEAARAVAKIKE